VVDRTVQSLKKKLAELSSTTKRTWPDLLQQAVSALNSMPKPGILHGDSPAEVKDDPEVQFLLQQDCDHVLQANAKSANSISKFGNKFGRKFRQTKVPFEVWTKVTNNDWEQQSLKLSVIRSSDICAPKEGLQTKLQLKMQTVTCPNTWLTDLSQIMPKLDDSEHSTETIPETTDAS
jgi:hypothetical protein